MLFYDVVSDVVLQRNAERFSALLHDVVRERSRPVEAGPVGQPEHLGSRPVGAGPVGQPDHLEVFMRVPYVNPLASDTKSETHRAERARPRATAPSPAHWTTMRQPPFLFTWPAVGSAKVPGARTERTVIDRASGTGTQHEETRGVRTI